MRRRVWWPALLCLAACAGDCEGCYERKVAGVVVATGARWRSSSDSAEERIALRLTKVECDPVVARVAGAGDGSILVDCLSTRCAALREGDRAWFACRHSWRLFAPDVIECLLDLSPLGQASRRDALREKTPDQEASYRQGLGTKLFF